MNGIRIAFSWYGSGNVTVLQHCLRKIKYSRNKRFFISNAFFRLSLSVAQVLLNTYKHYNTQTRFIFTTFVPMFRPRSIYIVSMSSIFPFHLHFHYYSGDYSLLLILLQGQAHLVSPFACNTRMIVDVSSDPLVSRVKQL